MTMLGNFHTHGESLSICLQEHALFVEGAFDNSVENKMNPDPSRLVPWGQMSEDEMFFGAFTWKNL